MEGVSVGMAVCLLVPGCAKLLEVMSNDVVRIYCAAGVAARAGL